MPRRLGNWELSPRAVFAVAAAPQGGPLHFIYAEGRLHHDHSADGGVTWSAPQFVAPGSARGNAPHLVFHGGQVLVYYAEQLPGEKWRHWQRRLDAVAP